MKVWRWSLFTAVFILFILFFSAHIFFSIQGKSILINKISEATGKKVSIEQAKLSPFFTLEVKNLRIENTLDADYLTVSPSFLGLFLKKIAFNEVTLIKPVFTYEKVSGESKGSGTSSAVSRPNQWFKIRNLFIKHIIVKQGRLNFIDKSVVQGEGLKITVQDIRVDINNTYVFPRSLLARFDLAGVIPWQEGEEKGMIEAVGWLDLIKKDMQANLKINGIDAVYLHPYYASWFDIEKARIEKAKLNFTSAIHGLNNEAIAQCRLELTDIVRKPRNPDEPEKKAERIANTFLDFFRSLNQGKIILDFTIKTRMDRPEFGFGNIKTAAEEKIAESRKNKGVDAAQVFVLPSQFLQGMVKGATDLSKAFIDGTFAVGNEVKNALEGSFRKEKTEE